MEAAPKGLGPTLVGPRAYAIIKFLQARKELRFGGDIPEWL